MPSGSKPSCSSRRASNRPHSTPTRLRNLSRRAAATISQVSIRWRTGFEPVLTYSSGCASRCNDHLRNPSPAFGPLLLLCWGHSRLGRLRPTRSNMRWRASQQFRLLRALPPPSPPIYSARPLPSQAPPPPSLLGGLQVISYPYFWMAGLNMAITTPLARAPQVNISAGAGEIISDISYMPFMGAAELRYGPFGVLADGLHIPLGVPITTRNIFFSGGNSATVLNVATGDFLYRLFERPAQTIDGGLGFRWWGASADTTLVGRGPVPTQSVSVSGSWADPLIAARYHRRFWPRVRADCLWRCRRLRDRCAFGLADLRHARLCLEPIARRFASATAASTSITRRAASLLATTST